MAELRTEEEQLDAIKRWWKDNGKSLIAGVVIACVGVFAWKAWQNYQANQAEAASQRYQQLLTLSTQDSDDDALREASRLAKTLNDEHGGTLYADLAELIEARVAIDGGDFDTAREALESLIERSDRPYLQGLARLSLARLQIDAGNPETALATLDNDIPEALAAQQADVRGDAYSALNRPDDARQAYQQALAQAQAQDQPIYGVQLKLDNLGAEDAS
ncbi:tetratricopeptide repeat protein [Halomonas shantousis]